MGSPTGLPLELHRDGFADSIQTQQPINLIELQGLVQVETHHGRGAGIAAELEALAVLM